MECERKRALLLFFLSIKKKTLADSSLRLNPLGPSLRAGQWNECTVIFFNQERRKIHNPSKTTAQPMGMLGTKWRVWPDMSFFPIEKDFISIGKLLTDGPPNLPSLTLIRRLCLLIQLNSLQVPSSTFGHLMDLNLFQQFIILMEKKYLLIIFLFH